AETAPRALLLARLPLSAIELVAVMLVVFSLNARAADDPPDIEPLLNRMNDPSESMWWPWLTIHVGTPLKNLLMSFGVPPPRRHSRLPARVMWAVAFWARSR